MTRTAPIDLPALLDAVRSVPAGRQNPTDFHLAVEGLLSALFYPALIDPQVEHDLHERRKRVDIRYTNAARSGFFAWLIQHRVPSQHVFVECKNYTGDPANPELDQLSSRFSPLRGQAPTGCTRPGSSRSSIVCGTVSRVVSRDPFAGGVGCWRCSSVAAVVRVEVEGD